MKKKEEEKERIKRLKSKNTTIRIKLTTCHVISC